MKPKTFLLSISIFFISLIGFGQQIGSGYAPVITDFRIPLQSGVYNGSNPTGATPDNTHPWQYLFVMRHIDPGSNHELQLASSFTGNDRLFFRKFATDLNPSNPNWFELATRSANTFNGNQIVNGRIFSSIATPEGGSLSLTNSSKATQNAAKEWILYNMTGGYTNSLQFWAYGDNGYQGGPKMTLSDNGNIGIGVTNPGSRLQVAGAITLPLPGNTETSEEGISFMSNHRFSYDGKYLNHYGFGFYPYTGSVTPGGVNTYMAGYYGLDFFTRDVNRMRIADNGNVGIGTANPDEKLTVNGTIHAIKVKVTATVPTADYVFQKYYTGTSELKSDYVMPTLAEIESFTKKNNHLPNIPSAKEMQAKGVDLGEMNNLLLQKVEELTLYAIEQQKKSEQQNKDIEELKALVNALMAKKQ